MKSFKEHLQSNIDEGIRLQKEDIDILNKIINSRDYINGPSKRFTINITKTLEDNILNLLDCVEENIKTGRNK